MAPSSHGHTGEGRREISGGRLEGVGEKGEGGKGERVVAGDGRGTEGGGVWRGEGLDPSMES